MSDLALGRGDGGEEPRLLAPVTVAILLAVGIGCFVATLLLGAYAPDYRRGGSGGHALSDAAIGYSGLVRLADATGLHPRVVRNAHLFATEDLLVASPPEGYTDVDPVLSARAGTPTLLVLPKWETRPSAAHPGWVTVAGLKDPSDPAAILSPSVTLTVARRPSGGRPLRVMPSTMAGIAFAAPRPLQTITDVRRTARGFGTLEPLITDARGGIVLGEFTGRPLFLLADPDLLDNRGMRDPATAAAALKLLRWMNSNQAEGIAFDVTLNGLGSGANPLKLLFAPPFLAATLTLAAAVLLAALGTVTRFGSPRPRARAVALGKTALVDNTAALVARAGAETRLGGRYAAVMREAAARAFAAPPRLSGGALDAYLDRVGRRGGGFTPLAAAVAEADNKAALLQRARALHDWMKGTSMTRTGGR